MENISKLEAELTQIMNDRAALSARAKEVQATIEKERALNKVRDMAPSERDHLAQAIQAVGIESAEQSDAQG